jgi:hypothetical protein
VLGSIWAVGRRSTDYVADALKRPIRLWQTLWLSSMIVLFALGSAG